MAKRMILMLAVMLALVGGLGFVKFKQVEAAIEQGKNFKIPPTAVTTVVAKKEVWPSSFSVIGTAEAIQGVTVSADLPGTIDKIHFESGQWVKEGEILVELDTRQERAQLASLEAQRDLAKVNYDRAQQLVGAGVIAKQDYDNATAQQKATEAQVGDIKAAIARKTIKAPFTGVLGIRQVSLGQYLAAGQAIVSLQTLSPIYVNFGVPQQDAGRVVPGHMVRVTNNDLPGMSFTGRINALDSVINEQTRNIQVQTVVTNKGNKLRPGMFVQVELPLGALLHELDQTARRGLARTVFSAVHGIVALGLEEKLAPLSLPDLGSQLAATVRAIATGRNELRAIDRGAGPADLRQR